MKQLKFEHQFAKAIVAGEKSATFRVNDDKDIRIGDEIELVDKVVSDEPMSWTVRGILHISDVQEVALRDLSKDQLLKAESFVSKKDMLQTFQRFYGEHIDLNSLITVLHFEYRSYESPRKFLDQPQSEKLHIRKAKLYADGGSRGNPGPSAYGFVVLNEKDEIVHKDNKYIGLTTNNQAEYHGALQGMRWCLAQGITEVHVYLDSLLVVNQLNGTFKVKNRDLWSLYETVQELKGKFKTIHFTHVPRELNKLADAEVNRALDAVKGTDISQ